MKYRPNLGRAEMDILRYIAEHNPVTVRTVAVHVAATKGQVRTTALNAMERLRKKGFLKRRKLTGVYHYTPAKPKAQLFGKLLKDFVDAAFGGSHEPFVAYLAEETDLTDQELRLLRQLENWR